MDILNKYHFDIKKKYQTINVKTLADGDALIEAILQLLMKSKKNFQFVLNTVEIGHNPNCIRSFYCTYSVAKGAKGYINIRMFGYRHLMENHGSGGKVTVQL